MNGALANASRLCVLLLVHAPITAWPILADEPQEKKALPAVNEPKQPELTALLLSVRNERNSPEQMNDLMLREIARQAFLIAARDELQIRTRDVALREILPHRRESRSTAVFDFADHHRRRENSLGCQPCRAQDLRGRQRADLATRL